MSGDGRDADGAVTDPLADELPPDVRALLADPASWERPSRAHRRQVLHALAAAVRQDDVRTLAPEPGRRGGPSRRWIGVVAVAAALVVGAVLATAVRTPGARAEPHAEVALSGPGGRLDLRIEQAEAGWRIELDSSTLPALAAGSTYELLLSTDGPLDASTGTFRAGGRVVLWSGLEKVGGRTATLVRRDLSGSLEPITVLEGRVPVPA